MNPAKPAEALDLLSGIIEKTKLNRNNNAEIVFCPPAIWLAALAGELKNKKSLALGAQNCHWELNGAFTGEISALMLANIGAHYVILGHSERRKYLGETDEIINLKIRTALKAKLKTIMCVGEKEGEEMSVVVEDQLRKDLAGLSVNQMKEVIIAYEPVWAIGTGRPCLPDNALGTTLFIRKTLTKFYSRFLAESIPVIYGGSVSAQNASSYITISHMNGLLVGGASLEAEEFSKLINDILG